MCLLNLPCGRPHPNHRKDRSQLDKCSSSSRISLCDVSKAKHDKYPEEEIQMLAEYLTGDGTYLGWLKRLLRGSKG